MLSTVLAHSMYKGIVFYRTEIQNYFHNALCKVKVIVTM